MKLKNNIQTLVLTAIMLCTVSMANGQTEKGRITAGGSSELSFTGGRQNYFLSGEKAGSTRYNKLNFSPFVGYFVMNDLQVIFDVQFKTTRETTEYSNGTTKESRTTDLSIGPSVCYYFPVGEQLRPYVQAGAAYAFTGTGDAENKFSGFTLGGVLGGAYFINKQASIELGLRYSHIAMKNKTNKDLRVKENVFAPILGLGFYF